MAITADLSETMPLSSFPQCDDADTEIARADGSLSNCDIVMKGGITSGVVYPAAVFEIAKHFVFKNVGGTSAGAIAAALTAAAERRRQRDGSMDGFEKLQAVPEWLATEDRLFRLFVPTARTKSLYRTVVGLFERPRFQPALLAKWCGLVWAFPIAALAGAAPGAAFLITLFGEPAKSRTWLFGVSLTLASMTVLAGMTIAIGVSLIRDLMTKLPKNNFGMVAGVDDRKRENEIALTTWLTRELEETAGLGESNSAQSARDSEAPIGERFAGRANPDERLEAGRIPLTFGMLWNPKGDPHAFVTGPQPENASVNLEMITTNVTWGRPYNFPMASDVFFFDPDELRPFFPDHVIAWMVKHKRKPKHETERRLFAFYEPRLPLPEMGDVPVILATRMSLAFPLLLSAVPLWAPDASACSSATAPSTSATFSEAEGEHRPFPPLKRCWFSDGGISSNFPITLFDSLLPRWPTFAINLAGFPNGRKRSPIEAENVSMIDSNDDGLLPCFRNIAGLSDFLGAAGDAAQNWNDNTQSVLPGYRDRIVTVFLDGDEGGLNLDMPRQILIRLKDRGAAAGSMIAARFRPCNVRAARPAAGPSERSESVSGSLAVAAAARPSQSVVSVASGAGGGEPKLGWTNHRMLRYLSSMGALRSSLSEFTTAWTNPQAGDVPYSVLASKTSGPATGALHMSPAGRVRVHALAAATSNLGADLARSCDLDAHLPKPAPYFVLRGSLKI